MSDSADQSSKTEPATPFKLQEARRRGNVASSQDVASVVGMLGILVLLGAMAQDIGQVLEQYLRRSFYIAAGAGRAGWNVDWLLSDLLSVLGLCLSLPLAMFVLIGVLSRLAQVGVVFSFEPMKFDLKRLNPVTGIKKLFNVKVLFELVKSLLKLGIASAVIFQWIDAELGGVMALAGQPVTASLDDVSSLWVGVLVRVIAVFLVFALLDLLFVRFQYLKQMRMSRHEVKEEVKRREGDPLVKSKRRQLERELRKRAPSLAQVKNADMVIVNPTRLAVLVQFDRESMQVPCVTGKGAGRLAAAIRQEARRHGVPIFQQPSLARGLYREVGIGAAIRPKHFVSVARLLRQAYKMRRRKL